MKVRREREREEEGNLEYRRFMVAAVSSSRTSTRDGAHPYLPPSVGDPLTLDNEPFNYSEDEVISEENGDLKLLHLCVYTLVTLKKVP